MAVPVIAPRFLRVLAAGLLGLGLVVPNGHATIYQWKDREGQLHYGDRCPLAQCTTLQLSPTSVYEAQAVPGTSPESIDTPPVPAVTPRVYPDPATAGVRCLDGIETAIGAGRVDPLQEIPPTVLDEKQYRAIHEQLMQSRGLWRGWIEEVNCKGSEETPVEERKRYEANFTISGDLKGRFELQSDEWETASNIRRNNVIQFLITRTGLRAGDTRGNINSGQWDVTLLDSRPGQFVYLHQFRRRSAQGASLPLLLLRAVTLSRDRLTIRELSYTNHRLGAMRTLQLQR